MSLKLHHGALSPFVRKVMICVHEKGLSDQIEITPAKVGATHINTDLIQLNPIGKIPVLEKEHGDAIYDSLVIIDFLDHQFPENPMIPTTYPDRMHALRQNATADGLLVAGVLAKLQMALPEERQWAEFIAAQQAKVTNCVAGLAKGLETDTPFNIGHAATAAALGWLDVRAPEITWRLDFPEMAAWFNETSKRSSLDLTKPPT